MEMHVFGFRLLENAPEGQKRFSYRFSSYQLKGSQSPWA